MPIETYVGSGGTYRKLTEWHVGQSGVRRDLNGAWIGGNGVWRKIFERGSAPSVISHVTNADISLSIGSGALGVNVGDLLISVAFARKYTDSSDDIFLETLGWNELLRVGAGQSYEMLISWRYAATTNQQTAYSRSSSTAWTVMLMNITGAHASNPIHLINSSAGIGTSAIAASQSPTIPSWLGLALLGHGYNTPLTLSGTGWAEIAQNGVGVSGGSSMIWGDKPEGSGASGNVNFTMADSADYITSQIIIAPP